MGEICLFWFSILFYCKRKVSWNQRCSLPGVPCLEQGTPREGKLGRESYALEGTGLTFAHIRFPRESENLLGIPSGKWEGGKGGNREGRNGALVKSHHVI